MGRDTCVWEGARIGELASFRIIRFWVRCGAIRLIRLGFVGFSMGGGGSFGFGLCFRFGFGEAGAAVSL
jgi:hypothetical protein